MGLHMVIERGLDMGRNENDGEYDLAIFIGICAISGSVGYMTSPPMGWMCFGIGIIIYAVIAMTLRRK